MVGKLSAVRDLYISNCLATRRRTPSPTTLLVVDATIGTDAEFTAEDVFSKLQAAGQRVSRATVFRTLRNMTEFGILTEIGFEKAIFRLPESEAK